MPFIPIPEGLQTRICLIGENLLGEIPRILRETWPGDTKPVRIVADGNTWGAAGERLQGILKEAGLSVTLRIYSPPNPLSMPTTPSSKDSVDHWPDIARSPSAPEQSTTW